MPNKRNPDAAELVRGHSARIVGDLVALLVLLKGLPLAYAKDLQDDKPPLFDAHDLLGLSLAAMAGMVADLEFVPGEDARRGRRGPCHRDRPRRLAGGARPACRSARRTISPGARSPLAEAAGKALDELTLDAAAGDRPAHRRARAAAPVGRGVGRGARLGWRDRAGPGKRGHRRGARRDREAGADDEAARLVIVRARAGALPHAARSRRSSPRPGQSLPVKPLMARATPDASTNC